MCWIKPLILLDVFVKNSLFIKLKHFIGSSSKPAACHFHMTLGDKHSYFLALKVSDHLQTAFHPSLLVFLSTFYLENGVI